MSDILFVLFVIGMYLVIHTESVLYLWNKRPVRSQAKELIHETEHFLKGRTK